MVGSNSTPRCSSPSLPLQHNDTSPIGAWRSPTSPRSSLDTRRDWSTPNLSRRRCSLIPTLTRPSVSISPSSPLCNDAFALQEKPPLASSVHPDVLKLSIPCRRSCIPLLSLRWDPPLRPWQRLEPPSPHQVSPGSPPPSASLLTKPTSSSGPETASLQLFQRAAQPLLLATSPLPSLARWDSFASLPSELSSSSAHFGSSLEVSSFAYGGKARTDQVLRSLELRTAAVLQLGLGAWLATSGYACW